MNTKLSRLYATDIRQARINRGWSRKRLAKAMRVPWIMVQQWEEGTEPEARYALRLYTVLGVRVLPVVPIKACALPQPRSHRVETVPIISWSPTLGKF